MYQHIQGAEGLPRGCARPFVPGLRAPNLSPSLLAPCYSHYCPSHFSSSPPLPLDVVARFLPSWIDFFILPLSLRCSVLLTSHSLNIGRQERFTFTHSTILIFIIQYRPYTQPPTESPLFSSLLSPAGQSGPSFISTAPDVLAFILIHNSIKLSNGICRQRRDGRLLRPW